MEVFGSWILVASMLAVTLMRSFPAAGAETYNVADDYGWTFPPNALATYFDEWALRHNFFEGDSLKFSYMPGYHNVLEVSQANLANCSTANPINTYTDSNETVKLNRVGYFGFTCGLPSHCEGNMKLELTVLAVGTPVPSPVTSTTPSSGPSPSAFTPSDAPFGSPSNDAPRGFGSIRSIMITIAMTMLVFLSFATDLLDH